MENHYKNKTFLEFIEPLDILAFKKVLILTTKRHGWLSKKYGYMSKKVVSEPQDLVLEAFERIKQGRRINYPKGQISEKEFVDYVVYDVIRSIAGHEYTRLSNEFQNLNFLSSNDKENYQKIEKDVAIKQQDNPYNKLEAEEERLEQEKEPDKVKNKIIDDLKKRNTPGLVKAFNLLTGNEKLKKIEIAEKIEVSPSTVTKYIKTIREVAKKHL